MDLFSKIERIIAALSAILCCACDGIETGPVAENDIYFNLIQTYSTKVSENTVDRLISNGFKVSSPGVMDNVTALYSSGLFKTGVYWPQSDDGLDFFAVYPPQLTLEKRTQGTYRVKAGESGLAFNGEADILAAVAFSARRSGGSVPLNFIHPLSYLYTVSCSLADDTPQYCSVLVDDISLSGVPEYGFLDYPESSGGSFSWTAIGSRTLDYCRNASHACNSRESSIIGGQPFLMIPAEGGRYTLTVAYRMCVSGVPAREQSRASMDIVLPPGERGSVNLVFKPSPASSCELTFGVTLDPWYSDSSFDYTIKL